MKINDLFNVENKVAVVTGGSRGIGEMITAGFLANGVKVYISARKAPALIEKANELSEKYEAECIQFHVILARAKELKKFIIL
jgi:Short-chain alcohol dehydrogenase of unknown specificity